MTHTIVCIDDEEHNNQALERLLRKDYKVITASNPEKGLELIEQVQPSIIISDQRMPEMTGVELLEKSMICSPDSIRILLTGYTDLESVIAAINSGQIYRYLTKPWEPADLLATIKQAVESYDLKAEVKRQNEELKSLDRLKTEFMLLISHELRTPLTGVTSFLELLKEEVQDTDHKMYCQHMQKNVDRMNDLVEDVLLITKFKSKVAAYEDKNVNIKDLVNGIWASQDNTTELSFELVGDDLQVNTSKDILKNTLSKLIENPCEHGEEKSKFTVTTKKNNDSWSLELANKANSDLPKDPSVLLNSFSKNEEIMNHTQGAGLGLSVVQSLTEHLNGSLVLNTKDNVFRVTLTFPLS